MLILKEAARPRTGAWALAGSCWATWTAGPASTATAKHDRAAAGQTGEGHGVGAGFGDDCGRGESESQRGRLVERVDFFNNSVDLLSQTLPATPKPLSYF